MIPAHQLRGEPAPIIHSSECRLLGKHILNCRDSLQPPDLEKFARAGRMLQPTISLDIEISERKLNFVRISLVSAAANLHFETTQTKWRWTQSEANHSPDEFPLTGIKTGIFRRFVLKLLRALRPYSLDWPGFYPYSGSRSEHIKQGINSRASGNCIWPFGKD